MCTARNNEGTTETKVEVVVEGGFQATSAPRVSVPEPMMLVVEGEQATLRCEAHGEIGSATLKHRLLIGRTPLKFFFFLWNTKPLKGLS